MLGEVEGGAGFDGEVGVGLLGRFFGEGRRGREDGVAEEHYCFVVVGCGEFVVGRSAGYAAHGWFGVVATSTAR